MSVVQSIATVYNGAPSDTPVQMNTTSKHVFEFIDQSPMQAELEVP